LLSVRVSHQLEEVLCRQDHHPRVTVLAVDDNRHLPLTGIRLRLSNRVVQAESFRALNLEVRPRQVITEHVRRVAATLVLHPAPCVEPFFTALGNPLQLAHLALAPAVLHSHPSASSFATRSTESPAQRW